MRVTVHYMAQIKRVAGCASESVEVPDQASLATLLHLLAHRRGATFQHLLLEESGEPRRSLVYIVGDEHADVRRSLHEGDNVTILTPMAGG